MLLSMNLFRLESSILTRAKWATNRNNVATEKRSLKKLERKKPAWKRPSAPVLPQTFHYINQLVDRIIEHHSLGITSIDRRGSDCASYSGHVRYCLRDLRLSALWWPIWVSPWNPSNIMVLRGLRGPSIWSLNMPRDASLRQPVFFFIQSVMRPCVHYCCHELLLKVCSAGNKLSFQRNVLLRKSLVLKG